MSEVTPEVPNEPTPEPTLEEKIIAAATEQGWRPDGPKSAADYLIDGSRFHGDLKKVKDDLTRENRKLYRTVAEHISKTENREFERETAEIQQRIRTAAEAGEADRVVELTKSLPTKPAPAVDPRLDYVDQWTSDNKWFNDNPDMRDDALGFYQVELGKMKGVDDPEVILPKVRERIAKLYPNYFKPTNPNRDRGPAGEGSRAPARPPKVPGQLTVDDLDAEERAHFDQFKASGIPEEKLLKAVADLRRSRGV